TVDFSTAGEATLTGLIGTNGAVGIFASDSSTAYVGGFVAAYIDCSDAGTPFDATCGVDTEAQLSVCRGTITALMSVGGQASNCQSEALSGVICGTGIVPGDTPFADICDEPAALVVGFNQVVARQVACAGENIALPSSDCMPVISTLCTEQPFNATAGTGAMTIDCTTGDTYESERESRITTCKDYVMGTPPENLLCEQMGVTDITAPCTLNPFASVCAPYETEYASERAQRLLDCGDDTAQAGKDCSGTLDVVCLEGGTPISVVCNGYNTNGQNIDDNREAFCRVSGTDSRCAPTRKRICDLLVGSDAIIHDALCTDAAGTYNIARGARCAETANAGDALALDPKCGTEEGADTYLQAFCDTGDGGSNEIHCPIKAARLTAWVNGALDSDGTTDLTILESVGTGDTNDTNYVQAGTDGLEIDNDVDVSGNKATTDTLMLSEAGVTDAPGSGVAFARIDFTSNPSDIKLRYYAGILSGTDLGEPLATPSDPTVEGVWNTALAILVDDRAVQEINTKLYFDFEASTFKSKNGQAAINVVSGGFGIDKFFIDGGFTTEGIVYGTTSLGGGRNSAHSDGTLTGLIGQKGLVAAFVSDGAGNTNEYVGGFVADNPDPAFDVDCSLAGGNAFDTSKCLVSTRATLCLARATNSVMDEQCQTEEIRGVICVAQG
ncbi:MAG: hypothetical protein K8953_11535, partial [Proteobacteria bacterium]|nr:hypothetical protein [Pseudomonadota bacterium]